MSGHLVRFDWAMKKLLISKANLGLFTGTIEMLHET